MGGEVDGVEEQRAAGVAGGHGAATDAGDASTRGRRVDGGVVDGALNFVSVVGVVGEQVYVDVKGDEEGFVFGGEDVAEEGGAGFLLKGKDVLLAAAGIEQDADGEGKVFLLREVLEGLELAVFKEAAVAVFEAGDETALIVDGEVDVDEVDVDVEGGSVGVAGLLGGGGAGGRRIVGGWSFLGAEGWSAGEEHGERQGRQKTQKG